MTSLPMHPWLPAVDGRVATLYTEASDTGSKFVEATHEAFAPLNFYDSQQASPFVSQRCDCGALNPDAFCVSRGGVSSGPFFTPPGGVNWQFKLPFELVPK